MRRHNCRWQHPGAACWRPPNPTTPHVAAAAACAHLLLLLRLRQPLLERHAPRQLCAGHARQLQRRQPAGRDHTAGGTPLR
jgi:hypothetical protein